MDDREQERTYERSDEIFRCIPVFGIRTAFCIAWSFVSRGLTEA